MAINFNRVARFSQIKRNSDSTNVTAYNNRVDGIKSVGEFLGGYDEV